MPKYDDDVKTVASKKPSLKAEKTEESAKATIKGSAPFKADTKATTPFTPGSSPKFSTTPLKGSAAFNTDSKAETALPET